MPNAAAGLLQVGANPSVSLVSGSARTVRRSCSHFTTFTVAVLSRNHTVGAAGIKKYGRICTACMKGSIGQKSQIREVHPDAGRCGCIQSH
jgi:hypothetical protein